MMSLFNLTVSEKHFILPSILNDSFAGYSNLGCRPLAFMTWTTSCQSLLACKISFEKSADSLMGSPLEVTVSFSLAASKILSLFNQNKRKLSKQLEQKQNHRNGDHMEGYQ